MSLIINHNLMAENALRNLSGNYKKLSTSVQRLSSGLRINSAADDAAGLAIREMMRADIAAMNQGIRNASDGISLIQTAEGAMAVIDEKLTRMKELAEQASTGTYTTAQREIINSEYQAMAKEIDRIANATNFNGVKLLDGSLGAQNGGQGLKIHFGVGNDAAEDYYFINIGDVRATAGTGLRIGGDANNDIWAQGGAARAYGKAEGCCAGGYDSLDGKSFASGTTFMYGYNWDKGPVGQNGSALIGSKYTAGMWQVKSGETSLSDLIASVNAGSQARIVIDVKADTTVAANAMSAITICLGDEVFAFGTDFAGLTKARLGSNKDIYEEGEQITAQSLTSAINTNSKNFWAMASGNNVIAFSKTGGLDGNSIVACEQAWGISGTAAGATAAQTLLDNIDFKNVATGVTNHSGANFSLGGEKWGTLNATQNASGIWNLVLNGRDTGKERDLWIVDVRTHDTGNAAESRLDGRADYQIYGAELKYGKLLDRESFAEVQNAADAPWMGAEIRTQDSAQKALEALDEAILKKDKIRATLGAYQNRLENTISNLEIQSENLQAAESRISDVDVAREMTNLTKNTVLVQAATSMVAQANSLNNLALSLLG